jgi:sigma-B regulation protein RsbU (phosphoserine phosphatase)
MTHPSLSREQALGLVRQLIDSSSARDIARLMALYADQAVVVSPVFGEARGRAEVAATWMTMFSTFAEIAVDVSDVLVDGDRIAILSTVATTDRSGWFGRPATGGPIGYRLIWLLTVGNGVIVRDERIYDSAGVVERLEKARLDKELRTAAEVQRGLLPRTSHRGRISESVGDSVPCRAIGGDFFEFLELPSGDVGIVMGDVSGKGPAAALLAAMLQGMFAVEAPGGDGPALTLSRINRRLVARHLQWRFATLVYGILSPDGRLVYANAGHNPPMLAGRGGVQRLTIGGTILGAFPDATFDEETLQLHPQDTLVMFTDGVTEARSVDDEEFGEDRLMACLTAHSESTPGELLNHIFAAVRAFAHDADQSDDITVTVTRFR